MTVKTNANSELAVAVGPPVANDAVSFALLSYTKVGELVGLGEAGGTFAEITHSPLDTRIVQSFKGSVDYGTRAVVLGKDLTDAGQIILIAAHDGLQVDTVHSFRLTESDGAIEYVQGRVTAYTRNHGTIDQIIGANVSIKLINSIVDA